MQENYKINIIKFIIILLLLLLPAKGFSAPEYSRETGKSCQVCHVDPAGGRNLTEEGNAFKNELQTKGLYRPLTPAWHIIRFIMGYLHMMTAIIWFGTILYVHILLKPAYASKGLPRGELTLGWLSIIVMTTTGIFLTIMKAPSWDVLFHTRFGMLLLIKIFLFLIMVSIAATVTFIIGPKLKRRGAAAIQQEKQDITFEEFSQFDGKHGRPAYVAFKEKIYDVSQSKLWTGGSHMKRHLAGFDLTEAIKQAPHGEEKISAMTLIGRLISGERKRPLYERVFFSLAYISLALTFIIIFIISLWNW